MISVVLNVEGMSCQHCVKSVHDALIALYGVSEVAVNLDLGTVTVHYDDNEVTIDTIRGTIEEEGYHVLSQ